MKRKIGPKANISKVAKKTVEELSEFFIISNWTSFTKEEKLRIALPVFLKGISDKHEHSGSVNVMGTIKVGGKPLEFDVGSP